MSKTNMIDRHYYVRSDQDAKLRDLAEQLNTKPAQLVRDGIDLVLEQHAKKSDWKTATRRLKGVLADDPEIDDRLARARKSLDRSFDISTDV